MYINCNGIYTHTHTEKASQVLAGLCVCVRVFPAFLSSLKDWRCTGVKAAARDLWSSPSKGGESRVIIADPRQTSWT